MLEQALETFQGQVEASLDRVAALTKRLKKLRSAAVSGDLREIDKSLGDLKDVAAAVNEHSGSLAFGFDDSNYFPDAFLGEILDAAQAKGLTVFAQDGKLYCYPLLVRVKPAERAVQIGKKTERGVRPSALAAKLRQLQAKPARFKPADFLGLLHRAYRHCASAKESPVLTLAEIYDVLARDLYLLDKSGVTRMDNGTEFRFSASTGTRNVASTFICIAEDGSEKRYYGIGFSKPGEATL
jgi:hypothetical protein